MARRYEIYGALHAALKIERGGRQVLYTVDFVRELAARNHHWSLGEANEWIARYQSFLRDCSTEDGERKKYFL
ncbi:hypothetical protein P2G74_01620 [Cronobacter muytjensii]|uniref:hypothetical protein n=1 Tax=Cronobacter muytjensii TaxID=413501 RepID=UPI002DBE4D12|nr:hypothetical protein [Cronobacter muytjensii]MEB8638671.1 hypothetical protein [Cronobacter muytjensii]